MRSARGIDQPECLDDLTLVGSIMSVLPRGFLRLALLEARLKLRSSLSGI